MKSCITANLSCRLAVAISQTVCTEDAARGFVTTRGDRERADELPEMRWTEVFCSLARGDLLPPSCRRVNKARRVRNPQPEPMDREGQKGVSWGLVCWLLPLRVNNQTMLNTSMIRQTTATDR
ncbi:hypothetical protein BaRGS_00012501 [Batillaria attramentaria]|uniref:Secreted protein n=1 Tax=Batillaria attramentaria TaxID=370345 RepID=A0ABD0LAM9_9CAEN